jgi:D-lactate dehydrogenase (cytochrome)
MVGSEGTLGVITDVTLKLFGIPEQIAAGVCPFPSVEAACDTVIATIQSGIPVARIELLDDLQIRACNAYSHLALPEVPTLFVEFHGTHAAVAEQAESFAGIAAESGGGPFDWATRAEDRTRLWQARHDAYWAATSMMKGMRGTSTDVCVPISRLAECVAETKRDIAETGLVVPIVGHVGDGNFHCLVFADPTDPADGARADAFIERLALRALAMDGTCSGEHGVGQGKMKYLVREHGHGVDVMRAVKRALDPDGIMNPGKIFTPWP